MQATLLSFRRGRHTQTMNQFLLEIEGIDSRTKAIPYIGSRVMWSAPVRSRDKKPTTIYGTITACHGGNGVLRVRFSRGLPGLALRATVKLIKKTPSK